MLTFGSRVLGSAGELVKKLIDSEQRGKDQQCNASDEKK